MRDMDRILDERPVGDELGERPVLWASEQKINAAIILSCECTVVRISGKRGGPDTNHGVLCVGKEGPTESVDLLNDERILDERRFLF